jgi:hypothetical protein
MTIGETMIVGGGIAMTTIREMRTKPVGNRIFSI